jgi:hypothetical protein
MNSSARETTAWWLSSGTEPSAQRWNLAKLGMGLLFLSKMTLEMRLLLWRMVGYGKVRVLLYFTLYFHMCIPTSARRPPLTGGQ